MKDKHDNQTIDWAEQQALREYVAEGIAQEQERDAEILGEARIDLREKNDRELVHIVLSDEPLHFHARYLPPCSLLGHLAKRYIFTWEQVATLTEEVQTWEK